MIEKVALFILKRHHFIVDAVDILVLHVEEHGVLFPFIDISIFCSIFGDGSTVIMRSLISELDLMVHAI